MSVMWKECPNCGHPMSVINWKTDKRICPNCNYEEDL